ncbi:type IVB secretion system protein IcmH/DotU [Azohydromonas aeria]|uniref:type IVB secretion system protein IcmH/DotU n=1 Tax=Azohydromonas aeria TaxID=2590212 RepID=UPI0012FC63B7|nr:type IVB secretion system protein IcmH/DotU [Azohydromonas aeria]
MKDMPPSASGATVQMPKPPAATGDARTLMELLYPGFYMVFLLRSGHAPSQAGEFRRQVKALLDSVEQGARRLQLPASDAVDARFAFCALLDEVVLVSKLDIRREWTCQPLQLELFGEHMAGERFFDRLEALRREGAARLGLLEVFHMCLLLGFRGRYVLEGPEKLDYLTARLGDEIVHLQGRRAAFAPHGLAPDRLAHKLQREIPLWVMGSVFAALALAAFLGLRIQLDRSTERELAAYGDIVQLAPLPAQVTITLP